MSLSRLLVTGVVLGCLAAPASAVTWNVDQAGACSDATCTPCCTIQAAVVRSSGGDTISVAPGTYPEEVDLRHMAAIGSLTLEASSGPGTVLVSPPTGGRGMYAEGSIGVITVDGIDFTTVDYQCIWLAHSGDAVLRNIVANGCGDNAIMLDNAGSATMENCTANSSALNGIQIDGASTATLTDCTANNNGQDGIWLYSPGNVDIVNPTADGNNREGIAVDCESALTMTGADVTNNLRRGIYIYSSGTIEISDATVTGNNANGVDLSWYNSDPIDSVTLTNVTADGNGVVDGVGIDIDHVAGAAIVTSCSGNNNSRHGIRFDIEGTITIDASTFNGNTQQGIDINSGGLLTITGSTVSGNSGVGIWAWPLGGANIETTVVGGNADHGILLEWDGVDPVDAVTLTGVTANGNGVVDGSGIEVRDVSGATVVTGCEANDNSLSGIGIDVEGTTTIIGSTFTGNGHEGVDIGWDDSDVGGDVTIASTTIENNSFIAGKSGLRIQNTAGNVSISGTTLDDNSDHGVTIWPSVVGDTTITGGRADGNGGHGYDLWSFGDCSVTGARARNNGRKGFDIGSPGIVRLTNCVANSNPDDHGIGIEWQDPDTVDEVVITDCTVNNNGLSGGGNGIFIKRVTGSVAVSGSTTNGNSQTGLRIKDTDGSILIRDVTSNSGLEEGIKIDADTGPVTIYDSTVQGNALEGIKITSETIELESVVIQRNQMLTNGDYGLAFVGFGSTGVFPTTCNDVAGNVGGVYLDGDVTITAERIWWGDPTGPSGQGPGAGDSVFVEPGGFGTIDHTPWLAESFTSPIVGCPTFGSGFESGLLEEWDVIVN